MLNTIDCTIYHGHHFPEAQGICVVIDVLRAFTTAAFAFAGGAKEIILVSSVEEAFAKLQDDPDLLLMGEVEGRMIEGFHFENSPSEMLKADLKGKRLVQRTSSGTQGAVGCRHATHLLLASFVVADATIKRILELQPSHVSLIATGRKNGDEDLALAEYLQACLKGSLHDKENTLRRVKASYAAQRMLETYEAAKQDLELATMIDRFSFAMEVFKQGGDLICRPVK